MKVKNIIIVVFILLLSATYNSCSKLNTINGNGHVLTEERRLVNFDQINNEGQFNVYISYDTIYQAIVEAETNLIPYIRTIVNGNTLRIDSRENLRPGMPINIYIKSPDVKYLELSGSGKIVCDSVYGDNVGANISGSGSIEASLYGSITDIDISGSGNMILDVQSQMTYCNISGSGDMYIAGFSPEGKFNISGSGNINSYEFYQDKLDAKISGSGNMYVNVADILTAKISGSGSIFYIGDPILDTNITGSGSVIKQ